MEDQVFESTNNDTATYKKAENNLKILSPLILVNGIIMLATVPFFIIQIFKGKGFMNLLPALIYVIFGIWHWQASGGLNRFLKNRESKDMLRFSDRIAFYFMIQGILIILMVIVIIVLLVARLVD